MTSKRGDNELHLDPADEERWEPGFAVRVRDRNTGDTLMSGNVDSPEAVGRSVIDIYTVLAERDGHDRESLSPEIVYKDPDQRTLRKMTPAEEQAAIAAMAEHHDEAFVKPLIKQFTTPESLN